MTSLLPYARDLSVVVEVAEVGRSDNCRLSLSLPRKPSHALGPLPITARRSGGGTVRVTTPPQFRYTSIDTAASIGSRPPRTRRPLAARRQRRRAEPTRRPSLTDLSATDPRSESVPASLGRRNLLAPASSADGLADVQQAQRGSGATQVEWPIARHSTEVSLADSRLDSRSKHVWSRRRRAATWVRPEGRSRSAPRSPGAHVAHGLWPRSIRCPDRGFRPTRNLSLGARLVMQLHRPAFVGASTHPELRPISRRGHALRGFLG